jgi:hypothetical protein
MAAGKVVKIVKASAVSAAVVLLVMAMAGCGSPSPSDVAKNFHAALLKGDMETAGKNCTPEMWKELSPFLSKVQPMVQGQGKIKSIVKETIDNDKAHVEVMFDNGDTDTFDLVKVDGKWKVHEDMTGRGK